MPLIVAGRPSRLCSRSAGRRVRSIQSGRGARLPDAVVENHARHAVGSGADVHRRLGKQLNRRWPLNLLLLERWERFQRSPIAEKPATAGSARPELPAATEPEVSFAAGNAGEVIPDVPERARQGIRGSIRVSVRLIVDKQGKVFAALVDDPGPSRYFEKLALEAAEKWTFPAFGTERLGARAASSSRVGAPPPARRRSGRPHPKRSASTVTPAEPRTVTAYRSAPGAGSLASARPRVPCPVDPIGSAMNSSVSAMDVLNRGTMSGATHEYSAIVHEGLNSRERAALVARRGPAWSAGSRSRRRRRPHGRAADGLRIEVMSESITSKRWSITAGNVFPACASNASMPGRSRLSAMASSTSCSSPATASALVDHEGRLAILSEVRRVLAPDGGVRVLHAQPRQLAVRGSISVCRASSRARIR